MCHWALCFGAAHATAVEAQPDFCGRCERMHNTMHGHASVSAKQILYMLNPRLFVCPSRQRCRTAAAGLGRPGDSGQRRHSRVVGGTAGPVGWGGGGGRGAALLCGPGGGGAGAGPSSRPRSCHRSQPPGRFTGSTRSIMRARTCMCACSMRTFACCTHAHAANCLCRNGRIKCLGRPVPSNQTPI